MSNQALHINVTDVSSMAFKLSLSNGNEAAFRVLFKIYEQKIFNYIFKIVKSKEISEELSTDVFMKVWDAKEILLDVQNLDAFLYRIAVNKALDFLRVTAKEKQKRERLALDMKSQTSEAADHALISREYEQNLKLSITQLPPQQKLIFNLSREDGFSHQQIADQLRISKNTVKNHMVSAIKHLKSLLKMILV